MFLRVFSMHHERLSAARVVPHRAALPLAYRHPTLRNTGPKVRTKQREGAFRSTPPANEAASTPPAAAPEEYELLSETELDNEFEFV